MTGPPTPTPFFVSVVRPVKRVGLGRGSKESYGFYCLVWKTWRRFGENYKEKSELLVNFAVDEVLGAAFGRLGLNLIPSLNNWSSPNNQQRTLPGATSP